jgi:hypothetical protein
MRIGRRSDEGAFMIRTEIDRVASAFGHIDITLLKKILASLAAADVFLDAAAIGEIVGR